MIKVTFTIRIFLLFRSKFQLEQESFEDVGVEVTTMGFEHPHIFFCAEADGSGDCLGLLVDVADMADSVM